MRHLESALQIVCVRWFWLQYPQLEKVLFAVPNGGKRNSREAQIMKSEGVRAGVSDLILLCPSAKGEYHSLCIEMKTEKGKQTKLQKEWQEEAEKQGNKYVVVHNIDEFMEAVQDYLNPSKERR